MTKVIGLIGDEGSGKTLFGVMLTMILSKMNNAEIYTNMKTLKLNYIDFNENFINVINNIKNDKNLLRIHRIAFIDEIHRYMDSRQSMYKQNIMFSQELVQIRKYRFDMVYTNVLTSMLDVRLRAITDIIINCLDYNDDNYNLRYNVYNKKGQFLVSKTITINPEIYNYYDTYETINNSGIKGFEPKAKKENKKIDVNKLNTIDI